jgi:endoglucanase Acf2
MSAFPNFIPSNGYPQPNINYNGASTPPLRTNSWIQNAIKGTTPPYLGNNNWTPFLNAVTKPLPWFVTPDYNGNKIILGHITTGPLTFSREDGNNNISIDPKSFIDSFAINNQTNLQLVIVDDMSAKYTLNAPGGTVDMYVSQGSPFIALVSPSTVNFIILFSSLITAITAISDPIIGADGWKKIQVSLTRNAFPTTTVATFKQVGGFREISIMPYYNYVRVQVGRLRFLDFTFVADRIIDGAVFVSDSIEIRPLVLQGHFVNGNFVRAPGSNITYDSVTNLLTYISPTNNYSLVISLNMFTATVVLVQQFNDNLNFIYKGTITVTKLTTGATGLNINTTGTTEVLMCVDDEDFQDDSNLGYVTLMNHVLSSDNGQFIIGYQTTNTSTYIYRTSVWEQYDTSVPITPVQGIVSPSVDISYGIVTLCNITTSDVIISFTPLEIIDIPLGPTLPLDDNTEAMIEKVVYDITESYQLFESTPLAPINQYTLYNYGTTAAKYGRLLMFARTLGVLQDIYLTTFTNTLTAWLTHTNRATSITYPDANQLYHETEWGGLITPADYYVALAQGSPTDVQSNFDMSFYNDHHFQFGYLIYAIYARLFARDDDGWITPYVPAVIEILNDYCAPQNGLFIKARHKDWYAGHSFATGLLAAVNINQESVSEAINSYYAAYLLATKLNTMGFEPIITSAIARTAQTCLYLEIGAIQAYWYNGGALIDSPSATIIQQTTRTAAAFSAGQPSSFPSKALYRYLIITLPITELTPKFLSIDWVRRFSAEPEVWLRVNQHVVNGLMNYLKPVDGWTYVPMPSPWDNNIDATPRGITAGGLFAFQILALTNDRDILNLTNSKYYTNVDRKVFNAAKPIVNDIVAPYDSMSNAFYVLHYLADYNEIPIVPSNTILVTNKPPQLLQSSLVVNRLVEVPTITFVADPTVDGKNVASVIFIVRDVVSYATPQPYDKVFNCLPIMVPESDVITTTFTLNQAEADLDPVLNAVGSSLFEKCQNLQTSIPLLIQYSYTKLVLARILYGTFNIQYLERSFNTRFFADLATSRFTRFIEYFTSATLLGSDGFIYNVIGYGSAPQQGQYYFI